MTGHVYACKTSPYYILQMAVTVTPKYTNSCLHHKYKNGMKWNESFPGKSTRKYKNCLPPLRTGVSEASMNWIIHCGLVFCKMFY